MSETVFTKVEKQRVVIRRRSPHVLAFLHGTINQESKLSVLRGFDHILELIWSLVCEEWWDLHIDKFPIDTHSNLRITELTLPWEPVQNEDMWYPKGRQQCAGCPVAVIAKNIVFPEIAHVSEDSYQGQTSPHLFVNMMPFVLRNKATLPECCNQYWPIIEKCLESAAVTKWQVGYLTIDERPVLSGDSQRRKGLHVESPGVLPLIQHDESHKADCDIDLLGDAYIPGAEHHWGGGMMMRDERVEGGIFMASNVANTTAVWNCQIRDEAGDFIGPHGDIERFRGLLGPCARTLDAGELVWMTDRTPHESLPVPVQADGSPARRQYFRLVIGSVTAWYADHSTPNPLGLVLPKTVRVISGNKFEVYPSTMSKRSWHCGTPEQLRAAKEFREFQQLLYEHGLGHIISSLQSFGIVSVDSLLHYWKQCEKKKIKHWDRWTGPNRSDGPLSHIPCTGYYEQPQLEALIEKMLADRKKAAATMAAVAVVTAADQRKPHAAVKGPGKGAKSSNTSKTSPSEVQKPWRPWR